MVLEEPDQKKTVLDMKYNIFSTFTLVLGRFFHGSGFFRIGSGFSADPDPDPEKKSDPDPGKKTGSETLVHIQDRRRHFSTSKTIPVSSQIRSLSERD